MMVDTKNLVPMTEANQNFSRVVRMVDESGLAVILKNNKPRYIVVDFGEYEQIQTLRHSGPGRSGRRRSGFWKKTRKLSGSWPNDAADC